jgi:hypothetical protein
MTAEDTVGAPTCLFGIAKKNQKKFRQDRISN